MLKSKVRIVVAKQDLRQFGADCESFLESNSPDVFALCETSLDDSIDSGNFSVRGYLPLIRKHSSIHMHGLPVYVKGFPFARTYLQKTLQILIYVFDWLYFTQRLTSFSSINHFFVFVHSFDSISFNINEVLLINPSADVFVFGDFNVYHKDWLTYSGETD